MQQRHALGLLFIVLALSFGGIALAAAQAGVWAITLAASALGVWLGSFAARVLRRR